jgi:anti-sigma B factor antagonist
LAPKSDSRSLSDLELANGCSVSPVAHNGGGVTVAIAGEVDIASAGAFTDELRSFLDVAEEPVTLDFQDCRFIDSTGIRALVALAQEQRARGRALTLSRLGGEPLRVLRLSGLLDSKLFATRSESRANHD